LDEEGRKESLQKMKDFGHRSVFIFMLEAEIFAKLEFISLLMQSCCKFGMLGMVF
jgi:hypothetical protein